MTNIKKQTDRIKAAFPINKKEPKTIFIDQFREMLHPDKTPLEILIALSGDYDIMDDNGLVQGQYRSINPKVVVNENK